MLSVQGDPVEPVTCVNRNVIGKEECLLHTHVTAAGEAHFGIVLASDARDMHVGAGSTACNTHIVEILTLTDDLGGYTFVEAPVYPLSYTEGSLRYYVNGVLQVSPAVTAGPPMTVSGISVPAGGNIMLVYEATVTNFAPLAAQSSITNTVTVTGGGLSAPLTAQEVITTEDRADLTVSKAICPAVVTDNSRLTYTFVIQNTGNTPAVATDDVIITDTFNPILTDILVTYNGEVWTEGVNYTYDETTGLFTTLPGITVPAATFTRNPDGTFTVTPGVATVTVTGTV